MQLSLFGSFQDNFIEAERRLNEALKHYNAAKKLRDDNCEHEHVFTNSNYYAGSYYDEAYTEHWNECRVCGARSEVTIERHSCYG